MGLQGYSSPTPNTVIFSTNYWWMFDAIVRNHMSPMGCPVTFIDLRGCYMGTEERSVAVDEPIYDWLQRGFPALFHGQESILRLGTPKAMNHRPATLEYLDGRAVKLVDIGVFVEVDSEEALAHNTAWTHCPKTNRWWVCKINPSDCIEEDKERKRSQAIFDFICAARHNNRVAGRGVSVAVAINAEHALAQHLVGCSLQNGEKFANIDAVYERITMETMRMWSSKYGGFRTDYWPSQSTPDKR